MNKKSSAGTHLLLVKGGSAPKETTIVSERKTNILVRKDIQVRVLVGAFLKMEKDYKKEFIEIIKNDNFLTELLKIVRELDLPDWFVVAGVVRNRVWDFLHGYGQNTELRDVDVIYFDNSKFNSEEDKRIEKKLREKRNDIEWDVFNQARRHLKNQKSVNSSEEALFYYSETANCIGVRLNKDGSFFVCAPYGFEDLMNLIVKPVPEPYQNMELFNLRTKEKGWFEKWPKLKLITSPQ
ncbi:MAG: nucleotidyltransferase family protein [archaeon]